MNAFPDIKAAGWASGQFLALLAWASAGSIFLLLRIEHALRVLHPAAIPFLFLTTLMMVTPIVAIFLVIRQWFAGDRQLCLMSWALVSIVPVGLCAAWGSYAYRCYNGRDVPKNLPMQLIVVAAASVAEARIVYLSPHRIETERLVMFYDDRVKDPLRDAEAMDRHVAQMQELTGLRLRKKIFYVRGPLYDERHMSFLGLAFGSSQSPPGYVDLHELAHATIGQFQTNESDPPTLLSEGWAESQSNSRRVLAARALQQRQIISQWGISLSGMSAEERDEFRQKQADPEHFLHLAELAAAHDGAVPSWIDELTSPNWYHHDGGAVYPIGGALTDYLIHRYGAVGFVKLYLGARLGSFEQQCVRVLGTDLKSLESDFWQEEERLVVSPRS